MVTSISFAIAAVLALAAWLAGYPDHLQAAAGLIAIAFVLGVFGG